MKRLLLTLAMAALMAVPEICHAKAYKSILVSRRDGTSLSIKGEQGMTLTVADNEVKFFTTGGNTISIPLDEVKSITLSGKDGEYTLAGVDDVADGGVSVGRIGDEIVFDNLPSGSRVSVVSLAGKTLYNATAEGSHSIDISSYTPGVYLVTFNKKTVKISIAR